VRDEWAYTKVGSCAKLLTPRALTNHLSDKMERDSEAREVLEKELEGAFYAMVAGTR
jgi:hypothetical protein